MLKHAGFAGLFGALLGFGWLVTACTQPDSAQPAPVATVEAQTTTTMAQHPGWQLASNCFQCHGTDGNGGFDRLKGMSTSEFVKEMRELQTTTESDEAIMRVHALAYTDADIQLMADYFARAQ